MQGMQFLDVLERMIPSNNLRQLCEEYAPRPRSEPVMRVDQVVSGYIFHQLQDHGTVAKNCKKLHGISMSDSAHSQRRQNLPIELFEQLMSEALGPLADESAHPECFYGGYRLTGVDGTQFSVLNTPAILAELPKAAARRLKAAFAKLRLVTLVELGTHAPLAAQIGPASEGEQQLAAKLWGQVPDGSLVIGDRLFGTGRTLWEAKEAWGDRDIAFLARVRENIRTEIVDRLSDGSAIVEVSVKDDQGKKHSLRVREIQARGVGVNGKEFTLRLWTSLLDETRYPAEDLARRYSERWEHGASSRRTRLLVGESPTEVKRPRPRSLGGTVARKQDGRALRQHTLRGVCAKHQVVTCSERRRSLVTRFIRWPRQSCNARRQQEPSSKGPMRRLSPAGYQRRHGATEDVETGEALDARRGKPVEEAAAITASGKGRCRHQGGGSGRSTEDGRAAKRARREGPGPVGTAFVKVRQGRDDKGAY
ncbi:MAG TPA: IS4 family transposase [Bryobacteraceae bacterium]|nr:IS4 family transposase [Bryobacteraceae bacterium]